MSIGKKIEGTDGVTNPINDKGDISATDVEVIKTGNKPYFRLADVLNEEAEARLSKEKTKKGKKANKKKKVSTEEKKKIWILTIANLLALALFAFLVPYLTLRYLDRYSLHGEYIEVPDIYEKSIDEGKEIFMNSGLGFEIVGYEYTDAVLSDKIIKQEPAAHSKVKEGRVIKVVISTNEKPTITIPDIVDNSSKNEAEDRLVSAGFVLLEPIYIEGEKDWVYGLLYNGDSLSNGNKIPMGSAVALVLGEGNNDYYYVDKDSIADIVPQQDDDKSIFDFF